MSWQKCPVCDGTGQMTGNYVACTAVTCPTCKGYRIIHEATGLPPEWEIPKTVNTKCETVVVPKWVEEHNREFNKD